MEIALQRELLRLKPELTVKELEQMAQDISGYWIYECLPDVLEATA